MIRKIRNRKGNVFPLGIFVNLIVVLILTYILVVASRKQLGGPFSVGENQVAIFRAMQSADQSMIYLDQGFSLSLQQALYDSTTSGGGLGGTTSCGQYRGYDYWLNGDECYPKTEDIKVKLGSQALVMLNDKFIPKSPYWRLRRGEWKDNYEVFMEQDGQRLITRAFSAGVADQVIKCYYSYGKYSLVSIKGITILSAGDNVQGNCGKYFYRPSLRKDLSFDIGLFEKNGVYAKEFGDKAQKCLDDGKSFKSCMETNLADINKKYKARWSFCERLASSDTVIVCANTGAKVLANDPKRNVIALQDAPIKFAMKFNVDKTKGISGAGYSAMIEVEFNNFMVNDYYQYRNGEWMFKDDWLFSRYPDWTKPEDFVKPLDLVDLTVLEVNTIQNLVPVKTDYDKGVQHLQQMINMGSDNEAIIYYADGCEYTVTPPVNNLVELARSVDTIPSGYTCD